VYAHDDESTMHISEPINPTFRTKHCINCGLNNHDSSEWKQRVQRNSSNNDIVYFQCKQMGHKRNQCPMNTDGPVHGTAALHQINEFVQRYMPNSEYVESPVCHDSHEECEIKLACGCLVPIVAGAFSPDGKQKLGQWQAQIMPCASGQVNDTAMSVMRDTRYTVCMVRSSLVEPEQVTGSYDWCVLVDGTMKRYTPAVVELNVLLRHSQDIIRDLRIGNFCSNRISNRLHVQCRFSCGRCVFYNV